MRAFAFGSIRKTGYCLPLWQPARGMRSATYMSVLVRAHLRKVTPIPKEELAVLKRSIAELRAPLRAARLGLPRRGRRPAAVRKFGDVAT
jgi:hypothetical protein